MSALDHLDEARRGLEYGWGHLDGSGTDAACIGLPIDSAARALLALAEEQRTANLIALVNSDVWHKPLSGQKRAAIIDEVLDRLGIAR